MVDPGMFLPAAGGGPPPKGSGVGGIPAAGDPPVTEPLLKLQKGQVLKATVLEVYPTHEVLLGMLGVKTRVRSHLALQKGQVLTLEVVPKGKLIQLKPLEGLSVLPGRDAFHGLLGFEPGAAGLTNPAGLLPQNPPAGLRELLGPLLPPSPKESPGLPLPSPRALKAFHEKLGLGFERRVLELPGLPPEARAREVKSLRANLRSLGGEIPAAEPRQAGEKAGEGRELPPELLSLAEAWRGEQVARSRASLPLVYPLPAGQFSWLVDARLFVQLEEEGGGQEGGGEEGRPLTLVFLLDLKALGPLRIDARILGADLSVQFLSPREGTVQKLDVWLPDLDRALEEAGLRLVASKVRYQRDGRLPVLDLVPPSSRSEGLLDLEL